MAKSSSNLNKQISSLTPDTIINLFEIDFSNLQMNFDMLKDLYGVNLGADSIYRFCPMENSTNPIVWQGKPYQPMPISMEGFEHQADGRLPRPKMSVANPEGIFSAVVHSNHDFANCKVTRKRTYARFLDDENFQNRNLNSEGRNPFGEADPDSHYPDDVYFINKKTAENSSQIDFELVSALELKGAQVPARVVLSNYCNWTYRCSVGCKYSGLAIESSDGESLTAGVIPTLYPDGISDVPEWSRHGINSDPDAPTGYSKGQLVKVTPRSATNPYKSTPSVFLCTEDHASAKDHNPFFDRRFWKKDECQKTLESCEKRFGEDDPLLVPYSKINKTHKGLRFGGFPSTERFPAE